MNEPSGEGARRLPARMRQFWQTLVIGLVTSMAVVVLHELGHYLPAVLFGFPGVALHYRNVSGPSAQELINACLRNSGPTCEAALYSVRQLWWAGAGGPIVSMLLTAFCIVGISRWYHPAWFVAGLQACASRVMIAAIMAYLGTSGGDEAALALQRQWPPHLFGVLELIVIAALYLWLAWRVRRGERLAAWLALVVSSTLGWIIWFLWLGPAVLP